jgi:hypothetical protein
MGEQDNITQGAREVADLLKEGKTEDVASRLRDDFQNMSSEEFRQFIQKVDQFNAEDRAANQDLPDIEFTETEMVGTKAIQQVEITTPGKVFGNWWRNSETVIDTEGGDGMVGHATSLIHGRNAQLAEAMADNSTQPASNENKPIEQRR